MTDQFQIQSQFAIQYHLNCQPVRVPTTSQLRKLESTWIESCHPDWGLVLMEAAGLAAAVRAIEMWEDSPGPVAIFCGSGNNGGDGLVVARHLARRDIACVLFMIESESSKQASRSESVVNRKITEDLGLKINIIRKGDMQPVKKSLADASLLIDALLGTGLDRPVKETYAEVISLINESGKPVLSLDIPSGIHSDTGQPMGTAIEADATITFGYLKAGLLSYPGAAHAGHLTLADIGLPSLAKLPPALSKVANDMSNPKWWLATGAHVSQWLPSRPANSHKGTFGQLLTIAGSEGMPGAAMLAARSALRTGVGLSVLATTKSLIPHLPAEEVIYRDLPETDSGTISKQALEALSKELQSASALAIGPGLTANAETIQFVQQLVKSLSKPAIVDADGLNALAEDKDFVLSNPEDVVFTPHPKELSRLLGMSTAEIQADRLGAAAKAVSKFGCNIVLKGAHTVVATPAGGSFIIPTGNAGMATAGSGDVLTGIIGALLAQGIPAAHAAVAGAYIHGAAGDTASLHVGEDGMIASDIAEAIPEVIADLRSHAYVGSDLEIDLGL
jgi:NAD(P)H-hydrate epimerase